MNEYILDIIVLIVWIPSVVLAIAGEPSVATVVGLWVALVLTMIRVWILRKR